MDRPTIASAGAARPSTAADRIAGLNRRFNTLNTNLRALVSRINNEPGPDTPSLIPEPAVPSLVEEVNIFASQVDTLDALVGELNNIN